MPSSLDKLIDALPEDIRDRVRERAAILWETGVAEDEANQRAYEMETGKALPGLARAQRRDSEAPASTRRRTGSSKK